MIDDQAPGIIPLPQGAGAFGASTAITTLRGHRFRDFIGGAGMMLWNNFLLHARTGAALILILAVQLRPRVRFDLQGGRS
jgi:hypothetical protein